MSRFKSGDRVRRIKGPTSAIKVGAIVTVTSTNGTGWGTEISVEEKPGIYFLESYFEPVTFKVGDRIKRVKGVDFGKMKVGNTYSVTQATATDVTVAECGASLFDRNFFDLYLGAAPCWPFPEPLKAGDYVQHKSAINIVATVSKVVGNKLMFEGTENAQFNATDFELASKVSSAPFVAGEVVVRIGDGAVLSGNVPTVVASCTPAGDLRLVGFNNAFRAVNFKRYIKPTVKVPEIDVVSYIKTIDEKHDDQLDAIVYGTLKANELGGKKDDADKLDWTLLPLESIEAVIRVLTFGAKKYGRNNWSKVEAERYIKASFRHIAEYTKGEDADSDTGESHMAHLACCALFLIQMHSEAIKARKAGGVGVAKPT